MSQVIVEFGSGNTCKNDRQIIRDMIDRVVDVDCGLHEIIFKWQLFNNVPPNVPLTHSSFVFAYQYAWDLGYQTTASVFDAESLSFLLRFDIPFVKIACRPSLYKLADGLIVPVYMSVSHETAIAQGRYRYMACVSEYPATLDDYERRFVPESLQDAVSDHTPGWDLWYKHHPEIIEKHVVIERDQDNPDAGPFAVTIDELAEVLQ